MPMMARVEFASQVEAINNSRSATLGNFSAAGDYGKIVQSTNYDSSYARINGVVSNSDMVRNNVSMNQ